MDKKRESQHFLESFVREVLIIQIGPIGVSVGIEDRTKDPQRYLDHQLLLEPEIIVALRRNIVIPRGSIERDPRCLTVEPRQST